MWSTNFPSVLFIFITVVAKATAYGEKYQRYDSQRFLYACQAEITSEVTICSATNYTCPCTDENYLATLAGCLQSVGGLTEKSINSYIETCEESYVTLSSTWYEDALKYYNANAQTASEIQDFNTTVPIDTPFILNQTSTNITLEAYRRFYANYTNSLYYGSGLLGYWALVLLLGAVANWSKILFPSLTKKMTNPIVNLWRKHVTMPALFGNKKLQEHMFFKVFGFLIPSRLESLVIGLFYGVVILCNALNMEAIPNDPIFYSRYQAEIRYVADRTGITATTFMPLVFLFAGRNNFLQWVTRWNFSTFIMYHRHTSRIMFMLIVIHAVCFTIAEGSYYSTDVKETYFKWGIIALVSGGIIMMQGMLYLRRNIYELFLLCHIILAAIWTGGAWTHVKDLGYLDFVYPTVAIWLLDRLIRILRLLYFGFPKADVILLADETLKVVIPKPRSWKSIPGGHAFIHFIKPTYFWQSHPFTFTDSVENQNSIVLYCKVKGGITHSLYKTLNASPGRTCKIRVGVEGPYGEATAARYADTAVFVAGGNGIPGIFSEVNDIARRGSSKSEGKNVLKLIWVVREWRSLYWFYEELMSLKTSRIETTIYITQPSNHAYVNDFNHRFFGFDRDFLPLSADEDFDCENKEAKEIVKEGAKIEEESSCDEKADTQFIVDCIRKELSHIDFKEGRPQVGEIVSQEIHESNGSVAFVTCGHSAMVDQLRYYCAENVDNKEKKRVDFYEQVQVWA